MTPLVLVLSCLSFLLSVAIVLFDALLAYHAATTSLSVSLWKLRSAFIQADILIYRSVFLFVISFVLAIVFRFFVNRVWVRDFNRKFLNSAAFVCVSSGLILVFVFAIQMFSGLRQVL